MGPAHRSETPSWVSPCPPRFKTTCRGLQRIIEGLTTLPVRGIATIGPALDPTRFRVTSNVSIASAASHSAIPRHAGVMPAWW